MADYTPCKRCGEDVEETREELCINCVYNELVNLRRTVRHKLLSLVSELDPPLLSKPPDTEVYEPNSAENMRVQFIESMKEHGFMLRDREGRRGSLMYFLRGKNQRVVLLTLTATKQRNNTQCLFTRAATSNPRYRWVALMAGPWGSVYLKKEEELRERSIVLTRRAAERFLFHNRVHELIAELEGEK